MATPGSPISVVPSAPAVSAPAPAPAASPVPAAQSAPVIPSPSAPAAPTATPAAGAPPSGATGPQPPSKLNPSEFGNAVDSYQAEVQWRQELEAFKAENPTVTVDDESPWPVERTETEAETPAAETATETPAEEKTAEEATKPDAEKTEETPAEPEESYSLADDPVLTPQALNDLLKGDEALKAAVEANPAAKGALFKMAREHAELSQLKGIFASPDSANFAKETSNRVIAMRAKFQDFESPDGIAKAFDSFAQEFAIVGADGKQVIDDQGQPVYGEDLYAFGEHIVDRYADSSLAEVEERIAANQYTSESDRERDNDLKLALSIIKDDLHPKGKEAKGDPDLSSLSPDVRAEVQARLDEAKRIESANAAKDAGAGKKGREQVRQEGTQKFFVEAGTRTFQQVDKIIDGLRKAGAVIPDWQLNTPLPGSNISAFKNAVGNEIESYIKADPYEFNKQLELEVQYLANPTTENMQSRIKAFDSILQSRDQTGKSLLNRIVTKLVRKYGADVQGATGGGRTDTAPTASKEPTQGAPVRPHQMTGDEAWKAAEGQLAKENSQWHNLSDSERLAETFSRQRQLLTTKR